MADVIENRIVEMDFENKDFEKNISQSISSLDKLDKALDFKDGTKGFDKIQNAVEKLDFSSITDSVSDIEKSFTTLAGSLERNFFDTISSKIISLGEELTNSTIGQIISGGKTRALNIEAAKFKVSGLNADWSEVYEDMDYAVSGTAFGIDEAANAASQLLASEVETGEDMKAALRGISGIAAMTSSSYSEIADIFTSAAGKGKVQAMELNRIAIHGVNAAATLANALGTTENEVREMSRKGEIDFQTFAYAMDNAFGEHAKEANKTFTGSLSNVKAALSRIGEIWYEPWLQAMIPVFNQLRTVIDQYKNALKTPLDSSGNTIATALTDLMTAGSNAFVAWSETWDPLLSNLPWRLESVFDALGNVTDLFKDLTDIFTVLGWQQGTSATYGMVDAIQNEANSTGKSIDWVNKKIEEYIKEKEEILDKDTISEIEKQVKESNLDVYGYVELVEAAYDEAKKAAEDYADSLKDVSSSVAELSDEELAYWEAYNYRSLFDAPGTSLKNYYNTFLNINNDVATITSQLGKNTVSLTKTTASSLATALDNYKTLWDTQHDTLENSINVYSKWSTNYSLSFKKLQSNLASNKKGLTQLKNDMATLTKNGASKELLDELKSQGASGAELVHALSKASKSELKQYEKDRKELKDLTNETTDEWTKDQKTKYEETISKLVGFSGVTIEEAKEMYNGIFKDMGIENAQSYSAGVSSVYDSIENTISSLESTMNKYAEYVTSSNSSASSSLADTVEKDTEDTEDNTAKMMALMAKLEAKYPGIFKFLDSLNQVAEAVTTIFDGLWYVFKNVVEIAGKAFGEVFGTFQPDMYSFSDLLYNISNALYSIDFSGSTGEAIQSGFRGIFSLFELGRYILSNFLDFLNNIFFGQLEEGAEATTPFIIRLFGALGEFIYEVTQVIEQGGTLPDILYLLGDAFGGIFENVSAILTGNSDGLGLVGFFDSVINIVSSALDTLSGFIFGYETDESSGGLFGSILYVLFGDGETSGIITAISSVVEELIWGVSSGTGAISTLFDSISGVIASIGNLLSDQTGNISTFLNDIFGFIHNMFVSLSKEDDGGVSAVKDTFIAVLTTVKEIFTSISETLIVMREPMEAIAYSIALLIQSFAKMISSIVEWVGSDPEQAYGAAAFFVLMAVLMKAMEVMLTLSGTISSVKSTFFALSRALNMGVLVGVQETIFDKLQKLGIAIGAIMAGLGILMYGMAKVLQEVDLNGFMVILIATASLLIIATVAIAILMYTLAWLMQSIIGGGTTSGPPAVAGGKTKKLSFLKRVRQGTAKLDPTAAVKLMAVGQAMKAIMEGLAVMIAVVIGSFIVLAGAVTLLLKYGGDEAVAGLIVGFLMLVAISIALGWLVKQLTDSMKEFANTNGVARATATLALVLFTVGVTFSMITVSLIFLVAALGAIAAATSGGVLAGLLIGITVILATIIAGIAIIIYLVAKASATNGVNLKTLFGFSLLIAAFGLAITGIIASIIALTSITAITGGGALAAAAGVVTLIAIILGVFIFEVTALAHKVKDMDTGAFILVAAVLGVVVNMFALAINQLVTGVIALSVANLKETTIKMYERILLFVGIMVVSMLAVVALIAAKGGGFSAAIISSLALAFALIAIGILAIAESVKSLSIALSLLSYAWPTIEKVLPGMIQTLRDLVPELSDVLAVTVEELCTIVIEKAPLIATAILKVIVLVIRLMNQKIPLIVAAWILLAEEILDLVLIGCDVLLPKVLAIIWYMLNFLTDNVGVLAYQLTKVLLIAIWSALQAAWDFLIENCEPLTDKISNWMLWFHTTLSNMAYDYNTKSRSITDNIIADIADVIKYGFLNLSYTMEWAQEFAKNLFKPGMDWSSALGAADEAIKERKKKDSRYKSLLYWDEETGTYGKTPEAGKTYDTKPPEYDFKYEPYDPEKNYEAEFDTVYDYYSEKHGGKVSESTRKDIQFANDEAVVAEAVGAAVAAGVAGAGVGAAGAGIGGTFAGGSLAAGAGWGGTIGVGTALGLNLQKNGYAVLTNEELNDVNLYSPLKKNAEKQAEKAQENVNDAVGTFKSAMKESGELVTESTNKVKKELGLNTESTNASSAINDKVNSTLENWTSQYQTGNLTKEGLIGNTAINKDQIVNTIGNYVDTSVIQNGTKGITNGEYDLTKVQATLAEYSGGAKNDVQTETINYGDYGKSGEETVNYDDSSLYGTDAISSLQNSGTSFGDTSSYAYGIDSESISNLTAAITSLQTQVDDLMSYISETFDNTIIMPKDTDINITNSMDGTEVGRITYPVIKSFMTEDNAAEEDGLATTNGKTAVRAGAYWKR